MAKAHRDDGDDQRAGEEQHEGTVGAAAQRLDRFGQCRVHAAIRGGKAARLAPNSASMPASSGRRSGSPRRTASWPIDGVDAAAATARREPQRQLVGLQPHVQADLASRRQHQAGEGDEASHCPGAAAHAIGHRRAGGGTEAREGNAAQAAIAPQAAEMIEVILDPLADAGDGDGLEGDAFLLAVVHQHLPGIRRFAGFQAGEQLRRERLGRCHDGRCAAAVQRAQPGAGEGWAEVEHRRQAGLDRRLDQRQRLRVVAARQGSAVQVDPVQPVPGEHGQRLERLGVGEEVAGGAGAVHARRRDRADRDRRDDARGNEAPPDVLVADAAGEIEQDGRIARLGRDRMQAQREIEVVRVVQQFGRHAAALGSGPLRLRCRRRFPGEDRGGVHPWARRPGRRGNRGIRAHGELCGQPWRQRSAASVIFGSI